MTHTFSFHGTLVALCLALTGTAAMGQLCTREYVPVCGLLPHATDPRTFPNRCVLDAAGARLIELGVCAAKPAPIIGHYSDGHGCKASAGYQWNEELGSCVRPWLSSAVTLQVAPQRQRRSGMFETQCLQVREQVSGQPLPQWTPLFGENSRHEFTSFDARTDSAALSPGQLHNNQRDGRSGHAGPAVLLKAVPCRPTATPNCAPTKVQPTSGKWATALSTMPHGSQRDMRV